MKLLGRRAGRVRSWTRRQLVDPPAPSWSRNQMLILLGVGAAVSVALVAGFVLVIVRAASPGHHTAGSPDTVAGQATGPTTHAAGDGGTGAASGGTVTAAAEMDALASRQMPEVDATAAEPGPVSTKDPGPAIGVPQPTTTGPAGVPSGFPHTAEGALAQMAAIDQTAMQSGSLQGVRSVIGSWALPGGPTATSWSGVAAMAALLDSMHLSGGGSSQLALVVTPLMGLVKGSVGEDAAVTCVDFEFDATLAQTSRVAEADCERMVWDGGHWMIGPGAEPAPPPSVWPDTDAAISAGYRDLRHG